MRNVLRNIVTRTYKPLLVKYLSKTRIYRYDGIAIEVPPEVFHPGFFFSTQLLLQYINKIPVNKKDFLELGAGSGLISFCTAKKGAFATASDINTVAIEFLHRNSESNNIKITVIESDLFTHIPAHPFDIIAINPPYYKQEPRSMKDHAWYCGENGEYFFNLFRQLPAYIHSASRVLMVLCDGCDINMIEAAATCNGFELKLVLTKQNILEKNFIYSVQKKKQ